MANPDGIKGIGGDRTFMDAYYVYIKLKKELQEKEWNNSDEKKKLNMIVAKLTWWPCVPASIGSTHCPLEKLNEIISIG